MVVLPGSSPSSCPTSCFTPSVSFPSGENSSFSAASWKSEWLANHSLTLRQSNIPAMISSRLPRRCLWTCLCPALTSRPGFPNRGLAAGLGFTWDNAVGGVGGGERKGGWGGWSSDWPPTICPGEAWRRPAPAHADGCSLTPSPAAPGICPPKPSGAGTWWIPAGARRPRPQQPRPPF